MNISPFHGPTAPLQPVLAESWEPRDGGKVWVYKIRSGVVFHDGKPMTARDVAATFNRHADPDIGSNSLSALKGILSKGGAVATDDTTVEFTLDVPYGNFPYTASSDNYNCIILKNGDSADFATTQNGTGPWKLKEARDWPRRDICQERHLLGGLRRISTRSSGPITAISVPPFWQFKAVPPNS